MTEVLYFGPRGVREAIEVMGKWKGRARLIAGGTNLIPDMRSGKVEPEAIVDLSGLDGDLRIMGEEDGRVRIGALVTISEIASSGFIRLVSPILSSAARRLGNPLTRNRATIGGNLADASPAADTAPPLLALGASVRTEGGRSKGREIPLDRFFLGPRKTALDEDELITEISFPKPEDPGRGSFIKLGLRNAMAISVASVAVMMEMDGNVCRRARVALGAVAPTPIRASRVEELLSGKKVDTEVINRCSELAKEEISPISDIRASARYREMVVSVLIKRAIEQALLQGGRGDENLSD
ncbi:MAG: xanthine dehydrogenase family protein subunit M [Deltaproteobacteria bacterium]|nr:xanthine dehydrogenase family protein subunit M [Deltaproteobacteria bacterium]MBW2123106.1 xanthine dehydrogenase family protein subunit M [Deltaproteobacteria bacterium]